MIPLQAAEVLRISLDCQAPPEGETVPATATMEGGEAAEGEAEGRRRLFQEAEGEAEAEASGSGDATCTPYMTPKAYAGDSPEVLKGLAYFQALMPYQQAASAAFTAAVESGNLTAMRAVYAATRPLYEQIEVCWGRAGVIQVHWARWLRCCASVYQAGGRWLDPAGGSSPVPPAPTNHARAPACPPARPPARPQVLAASFPNLDLALDAREYAFPEGERSPDFQGFHKLERLIFGCVGRAEVEWVRGWGGGRARSAGTPRLAQALACASRVLLMMMHPDSAKAVPSLQCCTLNCRPPTQRSATAACPPRPRSGGDVGSQTLEVARGVEQTLSVLAVTLNTTAPDRFTSASNWEGMLNLAHEVAAKKVSSEEETFSDLSIMIYYNNWKGILSQVGGLLGWARPAGALGSGYKRLLVARG